MNRKYSIEDYFIRFVRVILGETLEVCITLCKISKAPCSLFGHVNEAMRLTEWPSLKYDI